MTDLLSLRFVWLLLVFMLSVASSAAGALLPYHNVQEMCFTADLIIAGTHIGDGECRVEHVFYERVPANETIKTIDVQSIPRHSKIINESFMSEQNVPPISTNRLVLFLTKAKDGKLEPIGMVGKGSQGLFWYDEKACYGYTQVMNPGPYCLERSRPGIPGGRIPHGKDAMWEEIRIGLKQRIRWEAIEAIEDPVQRAHKMGAYLLPHTAPRGYKGAVNLRKKIREIGPKAVPALVEVLKKAKQGDNLNTTALTLYDIGLQHPEALRPAVQLLCVLLENPGPTSPYYVLCPLTAAGDPRATFSVRPLLEHDSKQVRGQAARALAAMKDLESFTSIAALIEDPPNPEDRVGYTLELARSLFELDPERARPIVEEIESHPGNAGLRHFIAGFE